MSTQAEIYRIKNQGRALKYAVLSIAAVGVMGAVFMLGGKDQYPTVQLSYPGKLPVAIIRDGVCTPYPKKVPQFFHVEYVSPQYMPCASQHYTNPTAVSPALAAIINHTK